MSDSVIRSTATVSICTGLSRVLGFAREILMAALFGTSLAQSAFVVAFKIPNLFRRLFGEGALSSAFVPVFSDSIEREGKAAAWVLAGRVMALLGTVLAGFVVLGLVILTALLAGADLPEKAALVLSLLRIMLPYMFFICLVALCMAILNSFHHFLVPASTPVVLNVAWIACAAWVCPRLAPEGDARIHAVAWAILVAGVLQLAVQVPVLVKFGFRGRVSWRWQSDGRVRRILMLMGPAVLGMGITQINVVCDMLFALWIGPWAPAALSFAERLIYLPLGVFATALGTVLLPVFSRQAARATGSAVRGTLNQSLRGLLTIMVPASVGLWILSGPIIELAFERGAFTEWSTVLTTRALRFYAPGLVVFSLYKVLVPAFYAMKDTRTPVRIGAVAVGMNLGLNILFLLTWPTYYKHAGLACATVISSAFSVVALAVSLHRRIGSPGWTQVIRTGGAALLASVGMAAAALIVHGGLTSVLVSRTSPTAGGLLAVCGSILAGSAVYLALGSVLLRRERAELLHAVRGRRSKSGT